MAGKLAMVRFDLAAVLADSSISSVSRLHEAIALMKLVVQAHEHIHTPDHPTRLHSKHVLAHMQQYLHDISNSKGPISKPDFLQLSQRICISQLIVYISASQERVSPEKARVEEKLQDAIAKERDAIAALAQIQREIAELRASLEALDNEDQS
jgi:hypothetical protein